MCVVLWGFIFIYLCCIKLSVKSDEKYFVDLFVSLKTSSVFWFYIVVVCFVWDFGGCLLGVFIVCYMKEVMFKIYVLFKNCCLSFSSSKTMYLCSSIIVIEVLWCVYGVLFLLVLILIYFILFNLLFFVFILYIDMVFVFGFLNRSSTTKTTFRYVIVRCFAYVGNVFVFGFVFNCCYVDVVKLSLCVLFMNCLWNDFLMMYIFAFATVVACWNRVVGFVFVYFKNFYFLCLMCIVFGSVFILFFVCILWLFCCVFVVVLFY